MNKHYATTYSNGHTVETNSAHEALNFVNYDDAQVWRLAGKQVTATEFFNAVRDAVDAAWDKKNQTHKRVRVLHGSSSASYVTKWIPR
jgi:ribose 5-phosphate isomerase RpiB